MKLGFPAAEPESQVPECGAPAQRLLRQKLSVVLHVRRAFRRPRIRDVILPQPQFPSQPPGERLVPEHRPHDSGQQPGPEIPALDVRPFVGEAPAQRLRILRATAAQTDRQYDYRAKSRPEAGKRLIDPIGFQERNVRAGRSGDVVEDLAARLRRRAASSKQAREPNHSKHPPHHERRDAAQPHDSQTSPNVSPGDRGSSVLPVWRQDTG
jgi:hypothetical protein